MIRPHIYAYTSKERAESGMGQWVAMLQQNQYEGPIIFINEKQITQLLERPEERFGLSEEKREQIWKERILLERRATQEAEERYPIEIGQSQTDAMKQFEKQSELQSHLKDKYEAKLVEKYGLTREQLEKISIEAYYEDWPFPKMK